MPGLRVARRLPTPWSPYSAMFAAHPTEPIVAIGIKQQPSWSGAVLLVALA